jgi:hypothetical protein
MTNKHTPGPWAVENGSDRTLWVGAPRVPDHAERYGLHTIITGIDIECLTPEARAIKVANAHLIAAAPDLLAACEAFVEAEHAAILDGQRAFGKYVDAIDAAKAAIAKARGQ